MSVECQLEGWRGRKIEIVNDKKGEFSGIVPEFSKGNFKLIKYIDLYGDTVFNPLQMNDLLDDWEKIKTDNKELTEYLKKVKGLFERCRDNPQHLIRFIGD